VLQETLGGRFGEMRTMMQFFFQSNNFRGNALEFRDLIRGVFLEEISHVELVQHTINQLLNGSGDTPAPGASGPEGAPLSDAVRHANPHHFIMGAQSSLPADASGIPWNGNYVYSHGNLISDLTTQSPLFGRMDQPGRGDVWKRASLRSTRTAKRSMSPARISGAATNARPLRADAPCSG
jgi:Mn-containing catalase